MAGDTHETVLKFRADTADARRGIGDLSGHFDRLTARVSKSSEVLSELKGPLLDLNGAWKTFAEAASSADKGASLLNSTLGKSVTTFTSIGAQVSDAARDMKQLGGGLLGLVPAFIAAFDAGAKFGDMIADLTQNSLFAAAALSGQKMIAAGFSSRMDRKVAGYDLVNSIRDVKDAFQAGRQAAIEAQAARDAEMQENVLGDWWAGESQKRQRARAEAQRLREESTAWALGIGLNPKARYSGMTEDPGHRLGKFQTGLGGVDISDRDDSFAIGMRLQEQAQTMRDERAGLLESLFGKPTELDEYTTKMTLLADAVGVFGGAMQAGFAAWVDGSKSAKEALNSVFRGTIQGIATTLFAHAIQEGALAVGALAGLNFAGAAAHGAAAAKYGAAAVAVGALARALGGGGGGGSGGGGGGGGSSLGYGPGGAPRFNRGSTGQGEGGVTNIYVGDTLAEDNTRTQRNRVARAVRSAHRELEQTRGVEYR